MKGQLSGSDVVRTAEIDRATRAVETIEYEHHKIHAGDSFHAFTADLSLGNNARHVLSFKTPSTAKWIHMFASVESTGEAEWKVYEDMTVTDNTGTSRWVYNRNRNDGTVSGVLDTGQNPDLANRITLDAAMGSGSAYGTVIDHAALGAGKKIGGEQRGINEWMLRPGIIYAFSLVSRSADNKIHIHLDWYEHTIKGLTGTG